MIRATFANVIIPRFFEIKGLATAAVQHLLGDRSGVRTQHASLIASTKTVIVSNHTPVIDKRWMP